MPSVAGPTSNRRLFMSMASMCSVLCIISMRTKVSLCGLLIPSSRHPSRSLSVSCEWHSVLLYVDADAFMMGWALTAARNTARRPYIGCHVADR